MKLTLALTATLALSVVVFALRRGELQVLEHHVGVLRQVSDPLRLSDKTVGFDPHPILAALRALCSGPHDQAESSALRAKVDALSVDELRVLCAAARREVSPPPRFLAAVAGWGAAALNGQDDALAAEIFAKMPQEDPEVARRLSGLLSDWIEKDPGAVLAWLKQALASGIPKGPTQRKEFECLAAQAAVMVAPVAELPSIRSLPEEEQGKLLGAGMRQVKSAEDTRAFAAAVITWPAAKSRDYVVRGTMDKLLEHDSFDAVAAWLDALPDATPEQKDDARCNLVMRDSDVAEMPQRIAWVLSQTDPSGQAGLAARITGAWVQQDYNAAGGWLHDNRAAPWFDAAASAFATGVVGTEPSTAFDWTLAISDEDVRRTALEEVMRQWRRNNPTAAAEYLQTAAIPDDWKNDLATEAKGEAAPAR